MMVFKSFVAPVSKRESHVRSIESVRSKLFDLHAHHGMDHPNCDDCQRYRVLLNELRAITPTPVSREGN